MDIFGRGEAPLSREELLGSVMRAVPRVSREIRSTRGRVSRSGCQRCECPMSGLMQSVLEGVAVRLVRFVARQVGVQWRQVGGPLG